METIKPEVLNLPWATLLTFASGYAAYYVANIGVREHHKPIDVTFSTVVFGFFATFFYTFLREQLEVEILKASIAAFFFAIFLGGIWSRFGRSALEKALRRSDVSYSDDLPNAWVALFGKRAFGQQLAVKLKDGTWLKCEDLALFSSALNGPCTMGAKGDLLMYVTHIQSPGATEFEPCAQVSDPEWGDEITYVPADQIARVDYRRTGRS